MRKRKLTNRRRYAVYVVHGEKCYMCGRPLSFLETEVEHVIPEILLNDPARLAQVLAELGLPPDFEINSYANWLPSCGPCNRRKADQVFQPSLLLQGALQRAAERSAKAEAHEQRQLHERAIEKAVATLQIAEEIGRLLPVHIAALTELGRAYETAREPKRMGTPVLLAPGVELISEEGGIRLIRGPYGVGGRPSRPADSSFDCPNCGANAAWNGARCVVCGMMDDD